MDGEPREQESSEVVRLHSTSVEHLQGTHQVSVEEKREGVRTYEGSKDPQYLPSFDRLRSCSHVKRARRRHRQSVNRAWLRVKLDASEDVMNDLI